MLITIHPHTLQFRQPAGTSRGVYHTRKVWYVVVNGIGVGECAPLPDLSCDALPADRYASVLRTACQRTALADGAIPYDFLRPYPSILFGLETALLSYRAARTTGNPYRLFDNAFSRGLDGLTINGLVWMGSFSEMMERMEEKLAAGFRCIKIKVGAIDWERELALIRTLRSRYPADVVELRLDANGGFSPQQAEERLQQLAPYHIHSIEQPIRPHQWSAMAHLCRQSPIPIALDEELIGVNAPDDKAALLDAIRPQYIILKPSLHGGLRGCDEWIRLADERHIGHWATSALESNVGLNAIAQWCGNTPQPMPSGLGTGQLFVTNFPTIPLEIRGHRLWCGSEAQQFFEGEYRDFLRQWHDPQPTLEVHTSGSTGTPQALRVEKRRMEASARMTLRFLRLQPGDTALLCMPLRYIAGKMMVVRAIVGQLQLSLVAPTSHPLRDYVATPAATQLPPPTFIALTPMQALATMQDPAERSVLCRIPRVIIGGGAISPQLLEALQDCEGEVYSTYGMTETLSHIAMRPLSGPRQSQWYTPLPGVSVSQDATGCLVVSAPALTPQPLTTHDLCEQRPDGTFRILGRTDNIISSGGIKLSLDALEAKLGDIGVPYQLTSVRDPLLGEALTLLYVGESIDATLLSRRLSGYERPRHLLSVEALPLTSTQKPARALAHGLAEAQLHGPR